MSEASTTRRSRPMRALLAERDFTLFLIARVCSLFAIHMLSVAIGWQIYNMTDSVLALGLVGLFQFAPAVFLFPITGLLADRFDRRLVLTAGYAAHALACVVFLVLTISDVDVPWPFYLTLLLFGTARAFVNPAMRALMPNLVPLALFPNAVACNSSFSKLATMAGPALSGVLLALVNGWIYGIMAAMLVLAALASFAIAARPKRINLEPVTLEVVLGGVAYIKNKPVLLGAVTLDLFAVLFGTVLGILPVFARDILNVGPEGLGLLRAMPAIGAFFVAAVLAQLPPLQNAGRLLFMSLIFYGLCIVGFGMSTSFWLSVIFLTLYGGVDMVSMCIRQTMMQLATPDDKRGRVGAVDSVFTNGSEELGNFRSGVMAAAIGPIGAVVFGGVSTILITVLWWKLFPSLRAVDQLDRPI